MARTVQVSAILVLCGALLLGGCSGAGVSTAEVRYAAVQSFAADHLAALVLVKGWLGALRSDPEVGNGCVSEGDFEVLPDGRFHMWGTNSDCSTYDVVIEGSGGEGTWVLSDGREVQMAWEVVEETFDVVREHIVKEFWDGARMEFMATTDFRAPITITREGTLTLTDGRAMNFVSEQTADTEEIVRLSLPDGSACAYTMPLRSEGVDQFRPGYQDGVDGVYTASSGEHLDFSASGEADGLDEWRVEADGLRGVFTLGEQYSGDGTITRDEEIVAALGWRTPASGTLALLTADSAEVTPSGAALDFAVDRWITSSAALGPMPMY